MICNVFISEVDDLRMSH